jgi:hypothetical protein
MESFAKAPELVSVEPRLRLQALRIQLTKSLLAIDSPLPPVLRNKTVVTETLVTESHGNALLTLIRMNMKCALSEH